MAGEIPQEEAQEPAPPPPPAVRMVVEDYDADNPQHYAQWVASGAPDLPWQTTWYEDLAEDGETYVRRQQPDPGNLTDVEKMQAGVQARLDGDEEKRTGVRPNPGGAVPLSRSWAATAMLYNGWHYPTEADLAAGNNPAILAKIYADPTTNTTDKSSVAQKQRALHFTLVMLEGQAFGLDYQAELGAYERTASGAFLAKLALDKRDWLDLPVHTWPSVRAMFADLMG